MLRTLVLGMLLGVAAGRQGALLSTCSAAKGAPLSASRSGALAMTAEDDFELEAARARLEKLVGAERNEPAEPRAEPAPPTSRRPQPPAPSTGFQFQRAQQQPPPVDDVANGLGELQDVGLRISGNFILLLEICIGGLTSPVGLASCVLFAALVYYGEFGDSPMRFLADAPSAETGSYYQPREPLPETYGAFGSSEEASEDPSEVLARLRGGAQRVEPNLQIIPFAALAAGCTLSEV